VESCRIFLGCGLEFLNRFNGQTGAPGAPGKGIDYFLTADNI
jgi:hypothetical protein